MRPRYKIGTMVKLDNSANPNSAGFFYAEVSGILIHSGGFNYRGKAHENGASEFDFKEEQILAAFRQFPKRKGRVKSKKTLVASEQTHQLNGAYNDK